MTSLLYYLNMNIHKKESESISEINRRRNSSRNGMIVIALLFVALSAGNNATSGGSSITTGAFIWMGLSLSAFAGLLWSLWINYQQADERQQLVQLKAASLTCMVVVFCSVSAQILESIRLINLNIALQVIIIGGILSWTVILKSMERRSL